MRFRGAEETLVDKGKGNWWHFACWQELQMRASLLIKETEKGRLLSWRTHRTIEGEGCPSLQYHRSWGTLMMDRVFLIKAVFLVGRRYKPSSHFPWRRRLLMAWSLTEKWVRWNSRKTLLSAVNWCTHIRFLEIFGTCRILQSFRGMEEVGVKEWLVWRMDRPVLFFTWTCSFPWYFSQMEMQSKSVVTWSVEPVSGYQLVSTESEAVITIASVWPLSAL